MDGVFESGSWEAEVFLGRVEVASENWVQRAPPWISGFGACGGHLEDVCSGGRLPFFRGTYVLRKRRPAPEIAKVSLEMYSNGVGEEEERIV